MSGRMMLIRETVGELRQWKMAKSHCSVVTAFEMLMAYANRSAVQLRSEVAVVKPQRLGVTRLQVDRTVPISITIHAKESTSLSPLSW
jgi:hypothetical protein